MTTPSPNAPASTPDVGGVEPLTHERILRRAREYLERAQMGGYNMDSDGCDLMGYLLSVVPACDVQGPQHREVILMRDRYLITFLPNSEVEVRFIGPVQPPETPVQETGAAATAKIIPDLGSKQRSLSAQEQKLMRQAFWESVDEVDDGGEA